MRTMNPPLRKASTAALALILAAVGTSLSAQGVPVDAAEQAKVVSMIDDWTHHHLVFSNPGTEEDAIRNGTHEQWLKTVNDPRYILQQVKRSHVSTEIIGDSQPSMSSPLLSGRPTAPVPVRAPVGKKKAPAPKRDWAVSLGTGTVAQNMYPAKYTFNVNATPSCTSDFVVYGLNVASATGGQANLVALNQLYSGTSSTSCTGFTTAQYFWAYNATTVSGGKVTTSPSLSEDGTKVIYVESGGSTGPYLHVLIWNSADGGTATASKAPKYTATSVGGCTAGGSCLVSILLNSTKETITYSSPFYDYLNDIVYVGDDVGNLYKVTPVLNAGTPVVTKLTVSSGNPLSSPVYDSNSGNIFVGGSYNLYAVKVSTFALQAHSSLAIGDNSCSTPNNILYDTPIVDSANGWVYDWVTTGTAGTYTVVVQAHTTGTNSPSGSSWSATVTADVGQGDSGCNSSGTFPTWSPIFDNTYYNGTVTSGHMWVCGRETGGSQPELWEIPTSGASGSLGTPVALGTSYISATTHAECSPMTEIYNGTTDYLFLGQGLSGTFGDLYGFTISTSGTATAISGSPVAYPSATGGTSAIVIDNVSTEAQASSIYFTTLATSTSVCGSTSAYCAIKLTQSQLE